MIDLVKERIKYWEKAYDDSKTKLQEFIESHQLGSELDDVADMSYKASLADLCDAGIRIKIYQNYEKLSSDDTSVVKAEFKRLIKFFKSEAGKEEILRLLGLDDTCSEVDKKVLTDLLIPSSLSADHECWFMVGMFDIMRKFEGVFNTGQQGVSLDDCVDMLNQVGMKTTKAEVTAQLSRQGLLDENNMPTQKAIDEGIFKPSDN